MYIVGATGTDIEISEATGSVTETLLLPIAAPTLALISSPFCTVLPAATSPVLLTEATAEFADAHVTLDVILAVDPSAYVPVAVSC